MNKIIKLTDKLHQEKSNKLKMEKKNTHTHKIAHSHTSRPQKSTDSALSSLSFWILNKD